MRARSLGRWVVEYRAGPLGIAVGGALIFQVAPFWNWGNPQIQSDRHPGFTTFSTFGYETWALAADLERVRALVNVLLNTGLGLTAVWLGYVLTRAY